MSRKILSVVLSGIFAGFLIMNLSFIPRLIPDEEKPSATSLPKPTVGADRSGMTAPPRVRDSSSPEEALNGAGHPGVQPGSGSRHASTLLLSVDSLLNPSTAKVTTKDEPRFDGGGQRDGHAKRRKDIEEAILVDVRDPGAFEKCRIPESINVPLYAVKTKAFLRREGLVLINEGFRCGELKKRCGELRELGFMAWVLDGGLNAWREAGGMIEGDESARDELNKVSSRDLLAENGSDGWIAVDARMSKNAPEPLPFARCLSLGSPDQGAVFTDPLLRFPTREKAQAPSFFVIFNRDGKQYEQLEKAIWKAGIKNAFYLKDGLEGYKAFLAQQAALNESGERAARNSHKCTGCL